MPDVMPAGPDLGLPKPEDPAGYGRHLDSLSSLGLDPVSIYTTHFATRSPVATARGEVRYFVTVLCAVTVL